MLEALGHYNYLGTGILTAIIVLHFVYLLIRNQREKTTAPWRARTPLWLCAIIEAYLLARVDGEVLPFEDIVIGLARDVHDRAAFGDIRLFCIRCGIRALDGERIRCLRGKGGGECARNEGTEECAAQLFVRCCFHFDSTFLTEALINSAPSS